MHLVIQDTDQARSIYGYGYSTSVLIQSKLSLGRFSISLLLCSFRTQKLIVSYWFEHLTTRLHRQEDVEERRRWEKKERREGTYHESDNRRQDSSQKHPSHIKRKRLHTPNRCPITNQTIVRPVSSIIPAIVVIVIPLPVIVVVLIVVDILICCIVYYTRVSWSIVNLGITIT